MNKHIPNKIIKFNDRNPTWMAREIKTAIERKHRVYKKFNSRGRNPADWERIRIPRNETTRLIDAAKVNYFKSLRRKLTDTKNWYQNLLANNRILNKNKVTCIPPLLKMMSLWLTFQRKQSYLTLSYQGGGQNTPPPVFPPSSQNGSSYQAETFWL